MFESSPVTGHVLNAYLKSTDSKTLGTEVAHLLFAANRWEKKQEIEQAISKGEIVICDRYSYSGIVYSRIKAHAPTLEFCQATEIGLPEPDVVFYLERTFEPDGESKNQERFDTKAQQDKIQATFSKLHKDGMLFPVYKKWITISSNASITEIAKQIQETYDDVGPRLPGWSCFGRYRGSQ